MFKNKTTEQEQVNVEDTQSYNDAVSFLKGVITENSDTTLQKAQKTKENESQDNNEDEYNEAYMKKYMKRFMKNNPDYSSSMQPMKKAVDVVNQAYENIEDELIAEATMVDGTEMFKAFRDMSNNFLKAIQGVQSRIDNLEQNAEYNTNVTTAIGEVLLKAQDTLQKISDTPLPAKGVTNGVGITDPTALQKAHTPNGSDLQFGQVKQSLMKAIQNDPTQPGLSRAMTALECCGGDMRRLDPATKKIISDLAIADQKVVQ